MEKKYIVSEDIESIILSFIGNKFNKNGVCIKFQLNEARKTFKANLEKIFKNLDYLSENEIKSFLKGSLKNESSVIISVDNNYLKNEIDNNKIFLLDITRLKTKDSTLIVGRKNKECLEKIIDKLAEKIKNKNPNLVNGILIDDVIFGGDTIYKIIKEFDKQGIKINKVISGIVIKEGFEKLTKKIDVNLKFRNNLNKISVIIEPNKRKVEYLSFYKEIIDEICERDFIFGLPNSGKYYDSDGKIYRKPYFLPFGNPIDDASIPKDKVNEFSLSCLEFSEKIWTIIENTVGKQIKVNEIPEYNKIYGVNKEDYEKNILQFLNQRIIELQLTINKQILRRKEACKEITL